MTTTSVPVPNTGQTVQVYANDAYQHTVLNLSAFTMYVGETTPLVIGVNAIPLPPGGAYPVTDHGPLYAMNPNGVSGVLQINDQVGQFAQVIPQTRSIDSWGVPCTVNGSPPVPLTNISPGTTYGNNHVTFNVAADHAGVLTFSLLYQDGTTQTLAAIQINNTGPNYAVQTSTDVTIKPQSYQVVCSSNQATSYSIYASTSIQPIVNLIPE